MFTHSVLLRDILSWSSSRLMVARPSILSGPTRARCITHTCRVQRSALLGWKSGRSNAASSFHTGATLFSATEVENLSLATCMMAYASFVPFFPLLRKPLAWSTVTWTLVGNHCWLCSARDMSVKTQLVSVKSQQNAWAVLPSEKFQCVKRPLMFRWKSFT